MTHSQLDKEDLIEEVKRMARDGRTITSISRELDIGWEEARSYLPVSSWRGAKAKLTNRLRKLATEPN